MTGPSKANDRQVGGDHYKTDGPQHWDMVAQFGLDYFQGQITKYLFRWRLKNGIEDLRKAQHYLEKYIELAKERAREWNEKEADAQSQAEHAASMREHRGPLCPKCGGPAYWYGDGTILRCFNVKSCCFEQKFETIDGLARAKTGCSS